MSLFDTAVTLGKIFPSSIVHAAKIQVFFMRLNSQLRQPITGPKNLSVYLSGLPTCQFPGSTWFKLFAIQFRNLVQQPRFFLGQQSLFKSKKSPLTSPKPQIFQQGSPSPLLFFQAYQIQGILSILFSEQFGNEIFFLKNLTISVSEGSNFDFSADLMFICIVRGWKQQGLSFIRLSSFFDFCFSKVKISSKFQTYSCSICLCYLIEFMRSRS